MSSKIAFHLGHVNAHVAVSTADSTIYQLLQALELELSAYQRLAVCAGVLPAEKNAPASFTVFT